MTFSTDQRHIVKASAAALAIAAAALAATWFWLPPTLVGLGADFGLAERMAYALKADLLLFLWLAGCVQAVASGRFRSPDDIGGSARGAPSPTLAFKVAVLQNSLEQTVLAVGCHLILATVLRAGEMVLISTLVALFLVGRVAFAIGYRRGRTGRAFGMALTGATIIAGYVLAIALIALGR